MTNPHQFSRSLTRQGLNSFDIETLINIGAALLAHHIDDYHEYISEGQIVSAGTSIQDIIDILELWSWDVSMMKASFQTDEIYEAFVDDLETLTNEKISS